MVEKITKKAPAKAVKAKTAAKTVKPKAAAKPVKTAAAKTKAPAKTAKKRTKFALKAPEAQRVFVAGCFNEWNPYANPMTCDAEGVWTCTLLIEPGEHEYRFVVDDVWWDDPLNYNRRQNLCGSDNCIIIVE